MGNFTGVADVRRKTTLGTIGRTGCVGSSLEETFEYKVFFFLKLGENPRIRPRTSTWLEWAGRGLFPVCLGSLVGGMLTFPWLRCVLVLE
jgi:hypothetical protein